MATVAVVPTTWTPDGVLPVESLVIFVVNNRRLIVLSFEGLATSALGCYGSSWNSTPAIDAIAGGGCVWDRWTVSSDDSLSVLGRWLGSHASVWMAPWRSSGTVELWTDDQRLIDRGMDAAFERTGLVNCSQRFAPEVAIEETQFGRLIAAAIKRDAEAEPWSVLWLHSRFLTQRWDAPRSLFGIDQADTVLDEPSEEVELLTDPGSTQAERLSDELPAIFADVLPPSLELFPDRHPDLVSSWMQTYGCQVSLIDLLIETLLNALQVDDPHVMILGSSGFNLGQNGWIGHSVGPLRSSELRLPLVVSDKGPLRSPQLTSSDALPSIIASLADPQRSPLSPEQWIHTDGEFQPRVVTESNRATRAVTTSRWYFVRENDASEHLFLKPDDVDDANDVARLRSEVVQRLDSGEPS